MTEDMVAPLHLKFGFVFDFELLVTKHHVETEKSTKLKQISAERTYPHQDAFRFPTDSSNKVMF